MLRRPLINHPRIHHPNILRRAAPRQSSSAPPAPLNIPTPSTHIRSATSTPQSTVHVGTSYEHLCAQTLPRLGFAHLLRSGGRGDRGIDLTGQWILPFPSPAADRSPPRVVVQCKATARKPGPEMIRELEGAVAGAGERWRGEATVGVLCAKREATGGVREAVRRSGRGIVWVMVQDLGDAEDGARRGRVKQILWNERVGEMVGDRVAAGVRYVPGVQEGGLEKEVCLMWDGLVWEPEAGGEGTKVKV